MEEENKCELLVLKCGSSPALETITISTKNNTNKYNDDEDNHYKYAAELVSQYYL